VGGRLYLPVLLVVAMLFFAKENDLSQRVFFEAAAIIPSQYLYLALDHGEYNCG